MGTTKIQSPRGTGDVLPAGQAAVVYQSDKWVWLRREFATMAEAHGYRYIETPIVEDAELSKRIGQGADIYTAGGGESTLALRADATVSVCRAVIEHGLIRSQSGLKYYYAAPVFHDGRLMEEKYRQSTNLGVEIFKEKSAAVDVELIAMLMGFYRRVGLRDLVLHIAAIGGESDHFLEVKKGLATLGISFLVDGTLTQGGAHDDKVAYAVKFGTLDEAIRTIGHGGRHDGLVEKLGGPPTPSAGFSTSMERILLALGGHHATVPVTTRPRVMVAYMDDGVMYDALRMAEELRSRDIYTEFSYQAKNIGKQFKIATEQDIEFLAIIGGEEWDRGEVMLKHYRTRQQEIHPIARIVDVIVKLCGKDAHP